ncbi:MAG TPA: hypothetical protein VJ875_15170 [Pyrinomonadaceae bacterium]|nr:hypothetical protein [Pyrinomonadaceae bacterium]
MYEEALSTAQEAWVMHEVDQDSGYPGQVADFHMDGLITVCLRLRDLELAKNYLGEWEWQPDVMPVNREVRFSRSLADVFRFDGRVREAIDWARKAVYTAEATDYQETKFASYVSLIRAYLAAGQLSGAYEYLKRLLLMRRSESKHDLYNIYLLLGDYRLSCACAVAGLDPLDIDYQTDLARPAQVADANSALRLLRRAGKLYDAAEKVGILIDRHLQCTIRRQVLAYRREQVALFERYC